jgi:hypothetical protein
MSGHPVSTHNLLEEHIHQYLRSISAWSQNFGRVVSIVKLCGNCLFHCNLVDYREIGNE